MSTPTFVLAPDSFKESMTAREVCLAMEAGLKKVFPDARYIHVPMADGGEGTTQSLIDASDGEMFTLMATGPEGQPVSASYGIMGDGETAVIEMASASGIQHTRRHDRNPLLTTTYGTGELIRACLDKNIKKIILGIGGSATNDGGAGMAEALGIRFYDEAGQPLPWGGGALAQLHRIDLAGLDSRLSGVDIQVACDVTNPLCGPRGASAIFGPQKGATPEMVSELDAALAHYAAVISRSLQRDVINVAGAGAAGGLGAGLLAFTSCQLRKGIDIVIEYSRLRNKLAGAWYCFTGEGRIDLQTRFGKTPQGVARAAKEMRVPVIAVAGSVGDGVDVLYQEGINAIFGIIPQASGIDELLRNGPQNVERVCENIARLLQLQR